MGLCGSLSRMSRVFGRSAARISSGVQAPAGRLVQFHARDLGAGRGRDLRQRLVGGADDDRMVGGPEQHVVEREDGLLRTGEDHHLVRADVLVLARNLGAQFGHAVGLRVAESQPLPASPAVVVGQGQQLGHGPALHVRGAQQHPGAELPAGEEALQGEVVQAHRSSGQRWAAAAGFRLPRTVRHARVGRYSTVRVPSASTLSPRMAVNLYVPRSRSLNGSTSPKQSAFSVSVTS